MERIEKTGMPSMVTMSFDKDPKSYDGHSPAECARALRDAGADIIGVNCLRNPLLLLPIAREMRQAVSGFVACQRTAYSTPPDVPDFTATKEFPFETETLVLSRKVMGAFAAEARAAGINYIGSCCGSMPVHVREMARALGKAPVDRTWRGGHAEAKFPAGIFKNRAEARGRGPPPGRPKTHTPRQRCCLHGTGSRRRSRTCCPRRPSSRSSGSAS